jgi:D-alanyl-D-alanine carboxypeptidase
MPIRVRSIAQRAILGLAAAVTLGAASAQATPYLVVDADSDQVLMQNEATAPWYPASLTKLMTVYVALDAVRGGKLTLNTPLIMSVRAARMPPSKMGFRPGTEVTLDNALKMLMVKSPNDIAVMVAEGVSGSVEDFADDMNATAQRLGLRESHFVNPNGLHNPAHVSSARDMAIVARALLREFPDHADLFSIGALQLGNQYIPNHNGLLGRYPGADGMKTGFTCPAGFNIVASANKSGRRLIVVVLGAPTARARNQEAANLFDSGFNGAGNEGSLESLPSGSGAPPNMRADVCLHRSLAAIAAAEDTGLDEPAQGAEGSAGRGAMLPTPLRALFAPAAHTELPGGRIHFDPVPVYIGPAPGWTGPALGARPTGAAVASAPKDASASSTGDADAKTPSVEKAKLKPVRHARRIKATKISAAKIDEKVDKYDKSDGDK